MLSHRLQDARCSLLVLAYWLMMTVPAFAQSVSEQIVKTPNESPSAQSGPGNSNRALMDAIVIETPYSTTFEEQGERVRILRGLSRIHQAGKTWTAPLAVIWEQFATDGGPNRVLVYLEGNFDSPVRFRGPVHQDTTHSALLELSTSSSVQIQGPNSLPVVPPTEDRFYKRAITRRLQGGESAGVATVQQAQYLPPSPVPSAPPLPEYQPPPLTPRFRRNVTISPRFLGDRLQWKGELSEASIPPEYVMTVTGGVNIVVDNVPLQVDGQTIVTRVDLTADRAILWTDASQSGNFSNFEIDETTPLQIYLEGNIVVRQGSNLVRASHAFYDINQRRGLLMNAEIRSFLSDYEGTLRLRAAELRQYSETNFHAKNAFFTTSEFGFPKYRVEASDVFVRQVPKLGPPTVNPNTGQLDNTLTWVSSQNNRVVVGDVPIFYAPSLSGPAEDPHIPIRSVKFGYSGMFGGELETEFDLDGIFGLQLPQGVDWTAELDYFTKRGPAIGTKFEYDVQGGAFGLPMHHKGFLTPYAIYDEGRDNLGWGRRSLAPADHVRGRILGRNRSEIFPGTYILGEVGHVLNNDRNFNEQYFETDWDTGKDLENLLYLHHQRDNFTASITATARSNDFVNQTDWLPKLDVTLLGEPVFGSPVLWSQHSSVGYGHLHQADGPPNPFVDPFSPLPYFQDSQGLVAMTRHELSLPFQLGAVNVAPYVLGEAAHWQEDLMGDELTRFFGAAGVRASIQFSKYMPHVRNSILGLNGLAHKVVFDMDYFYGSSTENLNRIPQYNEFDDNAQERFRSRFLPIEFGGTLPAIYDPRMYAVRAGAGRSVSSPYHELVDDQQVLWLGMRHRWQTKVGPPQQQRVIDWMELDLGTAIFPNADRDNFGEELGLVTGRYAWHVSPRTSLLANGIFDVFDDGQTVWNVGVLSQRSARGSVYLGYREVQAGPIDSQLITGSFSYVMSPNLYVATFGSSFDIAEGMDRGQSLTLTRIGESFLFHFGLGYDRSRDNVGVGISIEPKFGSYGSGSTQLNSLLGL